MCRMERYRRGRNKSWFQSVSIFSSTYWLGHNFGNLFVFLVFEKTNVKKKQTGMQTGSHIYGDFLIKSPIVLWFLFLT